MTYFTTSQLSYLAHIPIRARIGRVGVVGGGQVLGNTNQTCYLKGWADILRGGHISRNTDLRP